MEHGKNKIEESNKKYCPNCSKLIKNSAICCPYCGKPFPNEVRYCPYCQEILVGRLELIF